MQRSLLWWWLPLKRRLGIRWLVDSPADYRRAVFLAGTARSGTTWVSDIINYGNVYRYIFEPFNAQKIPRVTPLGGRRYVRPAEDDPELREVAEFVLSGRIRDPWTERFNRRFVSDRRLIKDVRASLFLKWLHTHFPGMPIVLVLRHPYAVALSYEKQGWPGSVEKLLSQPALLEDYLDPFAAEMAAAKDPFERALFIWCVETLVPLSQFREEEIHVVFYEHLVEKPEIEVPRLYDYLGRSYDPGMLDSLQRPSLTARRDSAIATGESPTDRWRARIGPERLERAQEIVRLFGLDGLYSDGTQPNVDALSTLMRP